MPPAREDVVHAVVRLRDEDGDARHLVGEAQAPRHAEALGDRRECRGDIAAGDGEAVQLELDALEEDALFEVGVLVGVDDVAVVPVEEVGDGGDQALLVAAGDQQRGGCARPSSQGRYHVRADLGSKGYPCGACIAARAFAPQRS